MATTVLNCCALCSNDDTILKFMARPYFIVSQMIILPLVGFHFMKILGAKLTFVYYAHIGIMGLAEAMRI